MESRKRSQGPERHWTMQLPNRFFER